MTQAHNNYPPGPRIRFPWRHIGRLPSELPHTLLQLAEQYGDIVHFTVGRQHIYLLNHPDFIQEVLISQQRSFTKGRAVQQSRQLLGNGLLTDEGESHLQQRRLLQPIFHRQQVANQAEQIVQLAEAMSSHWQAEQPIDLAAEMTHLTMNIISHALFSTAIDTQAPALGNSIKVLFKRFDQQLTPAGWLRRNFPSTDSREFHQAKAHLLHFVDEMLVLRKNSQSQDDILSHLLNTKDDQGRPMDEQQIHGHVMTLFLAGHETTASALSWTFYLLAQYPHIMDKVQAELDSVLAGRRPSAENYGQLEYTKMALSESMRLYPPAWVIGRQARYEISLGGYAIPQGATLLLSQWVTHHDPRYYPNPYLFKPERWLPKARALRPKMAYFPFGGGQRLCIGEHFAWMVGTLTIATVLQNWRFEQIPGRKLSPRFTLTLRPENGYAVRPVRSKL